MARARALGKPIFPLIEAPTGETFIAPDIQSLDLTVDRADGLERLRADASVRRALTDSRLRALALALGADQSGVSREEDLEDTELLAYLLDVLPQDRSLALDNVLRGDARVFGRLMTLRSAINTRIDPRDRHWADLSARKIPRHVTGSLEVRSVRQALQFRDASRTESISGVARLSHWVSRETHRRRTPWPRFQMRLTPKTGWIGSRPFSRFHWKREVRFANSYQRRLRIWLATGHEHAR